MIGRDHGRRSLRRAIPHGGRGRRDDAGLEHDRVPARALRGSAGGALRPFVPHPGVGGGRSDPDPGFRRGTRAELDSPG